MPLACACLRWLHSHDLTKNVWAQPRSTKRSHPESLHLPLPEWRILKSMTSSANASTQTKTWDPQRVNSTHLISSKLQMMKKVKSRCRSDLKLEKHPLRNVGHSCTQTFWIATRSSPKKRKKQAIMKIKRLKQLITTILSQHRKKMIQKLIK